MGKYFRHVENNSILKHFVAVIFRNTRTLCAETTNDTNYQFGLNNLHGGT